ncbi:4-hydroxythreonine-4-phosphate dehydrogenase PdxA [Paracrocinitomix mangrovi]|uniref:4-hydroxythreonine-4-phosphate dehydrogenase PdxA n=1 Tax=Paracrocinitomix mangrovi TaxID=2862509 RepID=UPI001C8E9E75|nr:4-hydroxythreonine-4-phosphate dehydrogenase PdxA [Paracrocinitomix mangrovi]UKN00848.1 4-hydroxythreonine-4-phosphate dehydrogenase PdxA [Paracrocinitomix mangrovi]
MSNDLIRVGITVGDINGVGLEVIIKTLQDTKVYENSIPIIYGSSKAVSFHKKEAVQIEEFNFLAVKNAEEAKPKKINVINCWKEEVKIILGEKNANGGKYALLSLEAATKDLKEGKIDVLVTAPINKDCVREAGFEFAGHTEYLAHMNNQEDVLMFMIAGDLRVGVVTGHVPLKDVPSLITEEAVEKKLRMMLDSLRKDFLIPKPRIAVLGLNPHAGDRGTIGQEELEIINPVISKLRDEGELIYGSYSADGFFGSSNVKIFDAILSMYHDQGLTGFKSISFDEGVNYTAGLPIVRTSPDHGTAYDIAGKNRASERSFRNAYFLACDVHRRRMRYDELHKNPLEKQTTKK